MGRKALPRPEGPYFSPIEAAEILGISVDRLYSWIARGRVATLRIRHGKRVFDWIPQWEVERLKKVKIPKDRLLTTREAAEILGVKQDVVSGLVRKGKLRGIKVGLYYKIPESEVLKLKNNGGVSNARSPQTKANVT